MIENYKGWDITLNWDNKDYLERDMTKSNFFNQKEKWIGSLKWSKNLWFFSKRN